MSYRIYRLMGDLSVAFATAGPALLCASLIACDSRAFVEAHITPTVEPMRVAAKPLHDLEPRPPLDETPITQMETIGAALRD
jgi:hypothetical protein